MELITDIEETFTEHNIQNAVFVFGQALLNIHEEVCQGKMTLCEGMKDVLKDGHKMLKTLKKVKGILFKVNVLFSLVTCKTPVSQKATPRFESKQVYFISQ